MLCSVHSPCSFQAVVLNQNGSPPRPPGIGVMGREFLVVGSGVGDVIGS